MNHKWHLWGFKIYKPPWLVRSVSRHMYLCSILFSKTSFVCTNQGIIKRYFYIFWKFHHNYERKVLAILCWCIFYVYFELVLPELYLKIPFFICRNSRDDIRRKLGFVYFLNFTWVSKWVSEWVSEWVGGWVGEWVSEWVSEVVSEWVSEWVCETSYPRRPWGSQQVKQ